jgi:DNA repair exonuclease SbcCD ATPase subunit
MAAVSGTATKRPPPMPYLQGMESSAWHKVPAKLDNLRTEIKYVRDFIAQVQAKQDKVPDMIEQLGKELKDVRRSLKEMQQDKRKIVALQSELKGAKENANSASKKWKKAALKVAELQSQRNVTAQLSDSDLISRMLQLRYQIRAFLAQYFAGKPLAQPKDLPFNNLSQYMLEAADRGLGDYRLLLLLESRGPFVIQSFL